MAASSLHVVGTPHRHAMAYAGCAVCLCLRKPLPLSPTAVRSSRLAILPMRRGSITLTRSQIAQAPVELRLWPSRRPPLAAPAQLTPSVCQWPAASAAASHERDRSPAIAGAAASAGDAIGSGREDALETEGAEGADSGREETEGKLKRRHAAIHDFCIGITFGEKRRGSEREAGAGERKGGQQDSAALRALTGTQCSGTRAE